MAADASAHYGRAEPDLRPAPRLHEPHDGLHFWQFMLAGSVAGVVEHTSMFPVDTLKTQMQAACLGLPNVGLRHALRSLLRTEGPAALYRGIPAMALGAAPAHAVYFYVYELSKQLLSSVGGGGPGPAVHATSGPAVHATSGVLATVASDAVFTPMDVVKQRLQLRGSPYAGVADCVRRVLREEGPRAFYASYRTTVLMNAPFTAVHFATYEAAKRALTELDASSVDDERLVVHATAGAAAGAAAAAVTTPLDVVKTQLQCQVNILSSSAFFFFVHVYILFHFTRC